MRLRTSARHAALRPLHRLEQAIVLLGLSTALLGTTTAVAAVTQAPAQVPAQVQVLPLAVDAPARPIGPTHASRDRALGGDDHTAEADPLPDCATDVSGTHGNGRLPAEALCPLPGHAEHHKLRPDAARGMMHLAAAYEEWFGTPLCLTDSYRSLGSQQALAARKPGLAAVPGTSEHGWGLAIDLGCGVEDYSTPQHRWMIAHGADFGWGQPDWAKDGGAREEPWHWEFTPSTP